MPKAPTPTKQETAKDGVAGLQSGNKIWENWLKTSLNPMVNLKILYDLEIWMDKVQGHKRVSTEKKLKRKGLPTCNIL